MARLRLPFVAGLSLLRKNAEACAAGSFYVVVRGCGLQLLTGEGC